MLDDYTFCCWIIIYRDNQSLIVLHNSGARFTRFHNINAFIIQMLDDYIFCCWINHLGTIRAWLFLIIVAHASVDLLLRIIDHYFLFITKIIVDDESRLFNISYNQNGWRLLYFFRNNLKEPIKFYFIENGLQCESF